MPKGIALTHTQQGSTRVRQDPQVDALSIAIDQIRLNVPSKSSDLCAKNSIVVTSRCILRGAGTSGISAAQASSGDSWKVQKALRQRKEPSLRRVVKEVYVLWRGDLRLVPEYQYVMPKVLYSLKYNPSTLK